MRLRRASRYHRQGPSGRRLVALTFDDGPGAHTEAVLDALEAGNARGTFFVLGECVPGRQGLLRRMVAAGHEVANHSFDHRIHPRQPVEARRQLDRTTSLVRSATGVEPRLFRPPGGIMAPRLLRVARRAGLTPVRWNVDPRDWESPPSAELERRVVEAAHDGAIVVLHDGGGPREATVAALPGIVRGLRERGYGLVPVSELLGVRCWERHSTQEPAAVAHSPAHTMGLRAT